MGLIVPALGAKSAMMRSVGSQNSLNLYLIGFMGVGKSVVGRQVARLLRLQFLDADAAIEKAAGQPIAQLFAERGEAYFRGLERAFIESGHPAHGCVVSCGGGLPCEPGMRELLLAKGIVVCLFARPETILARTMGNAKRPLLNVEDPRQRVLDLLAKREPIYLRTGIGVSTEGRSIGEVVKGIQRIYQRECKARARDARRLRTGSLATEPSKPT